jgi:hypothetical protein
MTPQRDKLSRLEAVVQKNLTFFISSHGPIKREKSNRNGWLAKSALSDYQPECEMARVVCHVHTPSVRYVRSSRGVAQSG